ncbi:MAG: hypothetical protein DCF21_11325 [Leptolyngbya sp.]|jgi:hypothetical protein|nr:MAG: hypothetical protein DCF21_11325 [Leptolyngbya sp.]
MLDVSKIEALAQANTPQELMAALVWQRRFNEFDGPEVMTDLAQQPHLWKSFLFTKPVYAPDRDGLSLNGVLETLLAMANYRPMPETSMIHFVPYPADTLYLLAENQDVTVAQLMDLGKKWRADVVDIYGGNVPEGEDDWEFREYFAMRLKSGLRGKTFGDKFDAVLICYWWD